MMKKGKRLERLVYIVNEALKDIPETRISSNVKLENKSGRKREIDVLIETKINGIEIKIAIECKDYRGAIAVEKIEAFKSKCDRIKGITKKVIVASNGYQADAIEAADDFNIDLYRFDDISKDDVLSWFPIYMIKATIKIQLPIKLGVSNAEEDVDNIHNDEPIIHFNDGSPSLKLSHFVWNSVVVPGQYKIQSCMFLDFMRGNCRNEIGKRTEIPYELRVSGVYIFSNEKKILPITIIHSKIIGWYEISAAQISEAKKYVEPNTETAATVVSVDLQNSETSDIVLTKSNDMSIFINKKDGSIYKLQTIGYYDPVTDELKTCS
jgi:hypothetical protein